MDNTRQALFGKFREEVDTHLLRLSQDLISLEQHPGDADLIKDIFRAAHTIKGAAKLMGFADIAGVTHEMESVLGVMREGQLRLDGGISNLLFEGIEVITLQTQLLSHPGDTQILQELERLNPERLIAQLKAVAGAAAAPVPATARLDGAANGVGFDGHGADPPPVLLALAGAVPVVPDIDAVAGRPEAHPSRGDAPGMKLGEDSVRVRVQKLDTLMALSGEMIITKMQYKAIDDRIHGVMELERTRARYLADLTERIDRTWGAMNQADMEAVLGELRQLDSGIDEMTARMLREFQEYSARLNSVADELQDTVLSVRMLPIQTLFATFPLAIRNFRRTSGKEVELQIHGGETEIDKQILESLSDPLIHLLRNALDHGLEPPQIRLAAGKPAEGLIDVHAYSQGTQVMIEIRDDGAGMDPAKLRQIAVQKNIITRLEAEKLTDDETLNLIYYPGFSTATIITDVSGRGVGMDVVKSTVERLNGSVSIESKLGTGTTITLRLPLTLATMDALLVRVGSQVFVLPSHTIEGGMQYIGSDDIFMIENHEVVRQRGRTMPLVRLGELLDLHRVESGDWLKEAGLGYLLVKPNTTTDGDSSGAGWLDDQEEDLSLNFRMPELTTGIHLANKLPGVIVGSGERQTCFLVDELIDELDVVVKSLGPLLGRVGMVTGATILGDGRVVIILDVPNLLAEARSRSNRGQLSRAWQTNAPATKPYILVVDDSITTRELEKSILENAGFDVDVAMDGLEALAKLEQQGQEGTPRYDLMIADIEMPRMDGLELTQRVKTHTQDSLRALPIIIVSSLASDAYKQRGIEVGAQAYITKGQFDQSHLLETIDLLIH
ncbi:MAG TPA: hybrid sensor histidine kinase/response regulator [Chloroflexia bacterium]|nr:hybrid sensor histidine kinase/response regulator [Chloroflexia bacterium]